MRAKRSATITKHSVPARGPIPKPVFRRLRARNILLSHMVDDFELGFGYLLMFLRATTNVKFATLEAI